MSYYQHGLDWKPKSISRDGSIIPKAQDGKTFEELTGLKPITSLTKSGESTSLGTKIDEAAIRQASIDSQRRKQGQIRKAEPDRSATSKAWAIATHPMTALSYKVKGQDIPEHFERGETNPLEYATDVLNPFTYIQAANNVGEGLGTMIAHPQTIGDQFLPTLMSAAAVLPVLHEIPGMNKFAQEAGSMMMDLPRAKSVKEAIGRVSGIPLESDIPRMGVQDVKALRQVQEIGRLRATNSPIAEQMKYGLENNLPEEHFQKVFGRSREEAQNLLDTGFGEQEIARSASIRESIDLRRPSRPNAELARLREQNRFEPVEMTPEEIATSNIGADLDLDLGANDIVDFNPESIVRQSQRDAMRARFRELDAMDEAPLSESDMLNLSNQNIDRSNRVQDIVERFSEPRLSYTQLSPEAVERIQAYSRDLDNPRRGRTIIPGQERSRVPLSMQLRQEIASGANKLGNKLGDFLGKNIQNYPYYSGEVLQKVPNLFLNESGAGGLKDISKKVSFAPEGIKSGDVFTGSLNTSHSSYLPQLKQVFKYTKGDPQFLGYKPMNSAGFLSQYEYEGKDIAKYLNSEIDEQIKRGVLPKDVQRPFQKGERVMLPHYGVKQHRKGGVIEDDRGQWAHPGEITKINSNQITMKGVDYPVLGISDAGDKQMMYPDQEYTFKGNTVTEYPQKKKNGGWLDKYQ
jgi:hypothetical protein